MQVMTLLKKTTNIDVFTSVNERSNEYFFRTCLPSSYPPPPSPQSRNLQALYFLHFAFFPLFFQVGRIVSF